MIVPYSLFMFRIITKEKTYDIGPVEPEATGFYFMYPKNTELSHFNGATFLVSFFDGKTGSYNEYEVKGSLSDCFGRLFFESEDDLFIKNYNKLLNDYLYYINTKIDNDEIKAMEELAGIRLSDDFCHDIKNWRRKFCKGYGCGKEKIKPVEIGVSLDCDAYIREFLTRDFDDFLSYYMSENCIENFSHLIRKVTHIYVGNQFCPYLLPKEDVLKAVIEKICRYEMQPVITFAPIPESLMENVIKNVKSVFKMAVTIDFYPEFVVNDYGTAAMLKKMSDSDGSLENGYAVTAGVLLCKRKKDPRIPFLKNAEVIEKHNATSSVNDNGLREYMTDRLGITKLSYEVTGYDLDCFGMNFVLHLPLYQTNTSGCVINSLCNGKSRGMRNNLSECPHYCNDKYLFFPDNMPIIGMWNSLFGISSKEINDTDYLNKKIEEGLTRIVLR